MASEMPPASALSQAAVLSSFAVFVLSFAATGLVLATRLPQNSLGWLFCAAALSWGLGAFSLSYAGTAVRHGLPLASAAGHAANFSWGVGIALATVFPFLLFPSGGYLSRRWRWVGGLAMAAVAVFVAATLLKPGRIPGLPVENPLGLGDDRGFFDALNGISLTAVLIAALAGVICLVLRFRRSDGEQRQQFRWLLYAGLIVAVGLIVGGLIETRGGQSETSVNYTNSLSAAVMCTVPIAMAIVILKYRLYDIDVVINKTLVFGALAAFITVVYVAVVVGIGALLGSSNEPNLGLSIAATAIVAIAFQPVKDRVERVANRLVYGIRRTPYEVLADFSDKVATSYETQEVTPAMARTLKEATGAARAEVWLALDSTLVLSASTEEGRGGDDVIVLDGVGIDAIAGADEVAAVTHQQELLGALAIAKERGEPVTSADRRLLSDLAAQAGIVLRNARLTAELQARLDEISMRAEQIRESRRRIVAAQDRARRRLERDIHDGAQQHLVALAVKLNLAKTRPSESPSEPPRWSDQLETRWATRSRPSTTSPRHLSPAAERARDRGPLEARNASAPFEPRSSIAPRRAPMRRPRRRSTSVVSRRSRTSPNTPGPQA